MNEDILTFLKPIDENKLCKNNLREVCSLKHQMVIQMCTNNDVLMKGVR